MKIKKSRVKQIIREELVLHIKTLLREAPEKETADNENEEDDSKEVKNNSAPKVGDQKEETPEDDPKPESDDKKSSEPESAEVDVGDDPSDDQISNDVEEPEPKDEKDIGGDISNNIVGKQLQSITLEPKSKMMAGAQELVLQFENDPHPLRILVGKSGMIKFVYHGSIHNEL